jgi:hypothetical protein
MSAANGVSDATVDLYISIAEKQIDSRVFGDLTVDAGAYLTAHLLKCDGYGLPNEGAGGVAAGPVTGITVGRVSIQYAEAVGSNGDLSRTRYGVAFSRLMRLSCPSPIVI